MKSTAFCVLTVVVLAPLYAQRVEYRVSFPNEIHHEAEISATFSQLPAKPLEVRMSRTSPGRYALHEFAKNVYNVKATDGKGNTLTLTHPNPHQWDIPRHQGTVVVTYTLFADHSDGTYSGIDQTHAHLNMPSAFMWARGLDGAPITIHFIIPKEREWKIATQLLPTKEAMTFTAPGLQYFMDCPTELSQFAMREWIVKSADTSYPVRIALHHEGSDEQLDIYAEMIKRVVAEEKAVYGELPRYDVGSYTFIADYLPYVYDDGMEHRNSTIVMSSNSLAKNAVGALGTIAHEYFHSWNVERMRPKSLEPFNFEEANMSGELWFAEGFTNYYGNLLMMRSGMISLDRFAKSLSGGINYIVNGAGRKYYSMVEMSEQAPFVDAATSNDQQNKNNTFLSYYSYGEVIALGLDLTLRSRFPGHTLDGFMRSVWKRHGKTEIPYTNEDLRAELGTFTGSPQFADSVFHEYVYGQAMPDYEALLSMTALKLRKSKEKKASIGGESLRYEDGKAIVNSPSTVDGPLYRAGLDRTDKIITIDKTKLTSGKDLDSLLARHKPGESVEIEYEQRGDVRTTKLTFEENNQLEVVPYETALIPVTDSMNAFRAEWLGSKAEEKFPALTKTCKTCKRAYPFPFEFCHFDRDTLKVLPEK